MKVFYKEIYKILKKIRVRFAIKNMLKNLSLGLSVGLVLTILLSLVSRFIPVYNVYIKASYIVILSLIITWVYSIIKIPDLKNIALKVDSFQLKERVSTALELEERPSIYKELLVQDAYDSLKTFNYKKNISVFPHKKYMVSCLIILAIFSATLFLPDPLKSVAEKKHEISQGKKEQVKKVDNVAKKIEEDVKLTDAQKKDLLAKLQQLKTQLKAAKNLEEVDKAVQKTTEKLELKKNEQLSNDMNNLVEKLAENNKTKELSKAIKNASEKEIKSQLDKLKMESMNATDKQNIKSALSKASASSENGEMKDALEGLESSLDSGDESAITSSVDKVSGVLGKAANNQNLNKAVAQAQQGLQGNNSNNNSQQASEGNGSSGQGQSQVGSGTGKGGGAGAGSGTSNGNAGVTAYGSVGIAGKKPGVSQEKQYEKIFTPSSLGGNSETSALTGKKGNTSSSSESFITDNPNAQLGELKPYDQVVGSYNDKAMESLNNSEIPDGMKEVVKGYFTSLQQ